MITEKLKLYRPLLIILGVSLLGAGALNLRTPHTFGNHLMGLFLLFLAVLQLFDWSGFATSFQRYDLLAAHSPLYARAYPLIEVILGIFYLGGVVPLVTNMVMIFIMLIGIIGILRAIRRGEAIQCACAGTAFKLPVGYVTVFEDLVMGVMAVSNLVGLLSH